MRRPNSKEAITQRAFVPLLNLKTAGCAPKTSLRPQVPIAKMENLPVGPQSHFNDAGTIHVVYHRRRRTKPDTVPPGTGKDTKLQPPNVDVPVSAIDTEANFPRRPSQHFRHRRNPNASHNHIGQFSPQRINDAFTTQNCDTQSSRNRGVLVNTRGQRRDIGRRS